MIAVSHSLAGKEDVSYISAGITKFSTPIRNLQERIMELSELMIAVSQPHPSRDVRYQSGIYFSRDCEIYYTDNARKLMELS